MLGYRVGFVASRSSQSSWDVLLLGRGLPNWNVHDVIGFGLVSHWLRKWREFC